MSPDHTPTTRRLARSKAEKIKTKIKDGAPLSPARCTQRAGSPLSNCGRVICSDCSSFRRFPSSRGKHRVCSYCSVEIANGGGRLAGGTERPSIANAEVATPQHHGDDQRGRSKLRQSIVGVFSSKSAESRSHADHAHDAPVTSSSRRTSHPATTKESTGELFDTSDDAWFADPVDNENGRDSRTVKRNREQKPHTESRQHDSYARPQVVRAPDSLFDVQFTNGNQYDESDDDNSDDFAMPRPTTQSENATAAPRANESRASSRQSAVPSLDAPLTMEDLQPSSVSASYVSSSGAYETALVLAPSITSRGADRTFYNDDADHLVVDDAPGYYDSMVRQQPSTQNTATSYNSSAPMPRPSLPAPASDGSSGILVEVSDVNTPAAQTSATKSRDSPPADKGFSGALKRFFGISKNKRDAPSENPSKTGTATIEVTAGPVPSQLPEPSRVESPSEQQPQVEMPRPTFIAPAKAGHYDDIDTNDPGRDAYDARFTIAGEDRFPSERQGDVFETPLRHTMAGYGVPSSRAESLMRASVAGTVVNPEPVMQSVAPVPRPMTRNSTRSRRDTFDDLFDLPAKSSTHSTLGPTATNLPARSWASPYDARATVGVARFDRPRPEEADDDMIRDFGSPVNQEGGLMSARGTPWSAVASHPSSGHAPTYATPGAYTSDSVHRYEVEAQVEPSYDVAREYETSGYYDTGRGSEPKRTIMDDLKPAQPSHKAERKTDPLDDFFADFEKPAEYVFDTATGSYVTATPTRPTEPAAGRTKHADFQSSATRQSTELRDERLRVPPQSMDMLEPVSEDADDEIDGIIANKISTLAGELEALKQLLQQRRVRSSPTAARGASTASRKQSIFDSDGSDSDVKPRPKKSSKANRRSSSRKDVTADDRATQKNRRTRKDSFADLFEDDAEESAGHTGAGTRSYEALFQIGQNPPSGVGISDDERDSKKLSRQARKRESKVVRQRDDDVTSGSDENKSLQETGARPSSSRFNGGVSDGHDQVSSRWKNEVDSTVTLAAAVETDNRSHKVVKKNQKRDAIDSLFDSDSDQDMGALFKTPVRETSRQNVTGQDVTTDSEDDTEEGVQVSIDGSRKNQVQPPVANELEPVVMTDEVTNDLSSDEEFSSTLKNLRGRRTTHTTTTLVNAPAPLASRHSSDADEDALDPRDLSLNISPSDRFQLSFVGETEISDDETVEPRAPALESGEAQPATSFMMMTEKSDIHTSDDDNASVSDAHNRTLAVAQESADEEHQEVRGGSTHDHIHAGESSPGTDSADDQIPSLTAQFDPLALLDEESETVTDAQSWRPPSAPSNPPIASAGWEADAVSIEKRLKALRFRDSLLDDDTDDRFGTSTSLNLDDLLSGGGGGSVESSDREDELQNTSSGDEEGFSFEIKPKKRTNKNGTNSAAPRETQKAEHEDREPSLLATDKIREKLPTASEERVAEVDGGEKEVLLSVAEDTSWGSTSVVSSMGDVDLAAEVNSGQFEDDWQRLQEQEKERKKKLQLKQRQAQREKLKKQSSSGRSLGKSGSSRGVAPPSTSPSAGDFNNNSTFDHDGGEVSGHKKKKKHRKKGDDVTSEDTDSLKARKADKRRHKRQVPRATGSTDTREDPAASDALPSSSLTDF